MEPALAAARLAQGGQGESKERGREFATIGDGEGVIIAKKGEGVEHGFACNAFLKAAIGAQGV